MLIFGPRKGPDFNQLQKEDKMNKPPCQGCPPCCPKGCTWDNSNATKAIDVAKVLIPASEYGCIHGGDIVATNDGRIGINRPGKTYNGFATLTDSGRDFLRVNRPEVASQLSI